MTNEANAVQVPAILAAIPHAGVPHAGVPLAGAPQVDALRALAHPVRWGILLRLAAEPGICACDFTEFFDVSQPTISAHLKVLREAGLVTTRRNGTTICYSIAAGRLESLSRVLADMAATAAAPAPGALFGA
ncbi:MAG TPA: metalloregulator ArsR/SmtB family transcription factor [Trebonia sp.]|nr:metalloregulator ArsR/SmtB family transcription factor [Trebonia sp.]